MKIVKKIFSKIRTPNFFRRFRRPRTRREKIFSATAVAIVALVVILGWHRFGAFAQSVIDTFTDSSKVSSTWRTYVDTTNQQVTLAQKSCDDNTWLCSANNICADTMGDGTYIIAAKIDNTTGLAWKNANTNCDQPQCDQDGGQDGDNLTADETVDFSNYPARNYCKSIGGRLPTITEMQCLYANKASFGNNIVGNYYYWTATEYSTTAANAILGAASVYNSKTYTTATYVRCVMGW